MAVETPETPAEGGKTPPPAPPPPAADPPKVTPEPTHRQQDHAKPPGAPAAATPPATPPAPEPAKPPPAADDDPDKEPTPDDKGMVTMPFKSFQTRVKRASKADLLKMFGTDDRDKLLQWKKDYDGYQTKQEEERRAKLAEEERLKEDIEKEKKARERAEKKLQDREEQILIDRQEREIRNVCSKHIDSEYVDDVALPAFAKHCAALSEEEREALTEADVEAWFKDYAAKKPKLAKEAGGTQTPTTPTTPIVQQKINTGAGPRMRPVPPPAGALQGKTPKPGQANSMTKQELAEYKKQSGFQW